MTKALIDPNTVIKDPNTDQSIGIKIAQVADNEFPVSIPLYWIFCPDSTNASTDYYDQDTQEIKQIPKYIITAAQNKNIAVRLLQNTDWVTLSDVDNPSLTPHLLNKTDFINYRTILRSIAVNPVGGDIDWPIKPTEQWSS